MDPTTLRAAAALAVEVREVFLATTSPAGLPHLAVARSLALDRRNRVVVGSWFCPATVRNLRDNRRLAIVVWDSRADLGYQLIGRMEKLEEMGILASHALQFADVDPMPQVERELTVRVDDILVFKHAPHADAAE